MSGGHEGKYENTVCTKWAMDSRSSFIDIQIHGLWHVQYLDMYDMSKVGCSYSNYKIGITTFVIPHTMEFRGV